MEIPQHQENHQDQTSIINNNNNAVIPPVGATIATPYGEGGVLSKVDLESTHFTFHIDYPWGKVSIPCTFDEEGRKKQRESIKWRKKLFEMTTEEKIQRADELRLEGNSSFKRHFYEQAIHKYEIAKVYLSHLDEPGRPSNGDREQYIFPCLNNLALAYLNVNDNQQSIVSANELIAAYEKNDHENPQIIVKALFTRARANAANGNLESSIKDLIRACKIDPSNHKLREELAAVKRKIKEADDKQKSMFKAAFEARARGPSDSDENLKEPAVPEGDAAKEAATPAPTSKPVDVSAAVALALTGFVPQSNSKNSSKSQPVENGKSPKASSGPKKVRVSKSDTASNERNWNFAYASLLIGIVALSAMATVQVMSRSR